MISGKRLKLSIKGSGLNMEEAAKKLGISRTTLYSYFTMAELPGDVVQNVKAKLGIDVSVPTEHGTTKTPTSTDAGVNTDPVMPGIYQDIIKALIKRSDDLADLAKAQIRLTDALLDERQTIRGTAAVAVSLGTNLNTLEHRTEDIERELKQVQQAIVYGFSASLNKKPKDVETLLSTGGWPGSGKVSGKKERSDN